MDKSVRDILTGCYHKAVEVIRENRQDMWERVQRSGLIDVWRFQTHFDIEKSFGLLGRKTPSVWAGKDATFSTGCTKEMHIALSMQARQPELQIIGPDPQKFLRRREYGVGRFCDAGIGCR